MAMASAPSTRSAGQDIETPPPLRDASTMHTADSELENDDEVAGPSARWTPGSQPSTTTGVRGAGTKKTDFDAPPSSRGPKKMTDMEAIMITYGYTPEATDSEVYQRREVIKSLEHHSSDYSGVRLFFIKAASSFSFQAFFCTLIVLNAITMGFEADADDADTKDIYQKLETVYCALFLIEVIVRIVGSVAPPWKDLPLILDTLIVLISVVDNFIIDNLQDPDTDEEEIDLSIITVMRVLRVVRVLRVFRAIAVFRPIRVLMASTAKAVTNLVWIVVLLLVMFYCFGLTFRMLLQHLEPGHAVRPVVDTHFSSVGTCIVTGLEVLLGGFNWTPSITTPLMENSDTFFTSLIWLFFVSMVQICVANMIVGVFVEQLLTIAKQTDEQVVKEQLVMKMANIVELRKVFDEIDENRDGKVSRQEFRLALKDKPQLSMQIGLDPVEAETLFDTADYSMDSTMEIEELIFGVVKLRGGSKTIDAMCFDYQIKQIIRQMQRSPQSFKELGNKLEEAGKELHDLTNQMEKMKHTVTDKLPDYAYRISNLEKQMGNFMTRLQVPAIDKKEVIMRGGGTPPLSLANLRESYQLAEEMRELRKVVEQATARTNPAVAPIISPRPAAANGAANAHSLNGAANAHPLDSSWKTKP